MLQRKIIIIFNMISSSLLWILFRGVKHWYLLLLLLSEVVEVCFDLFVGLVDALDLAEPKNSNFCCCSHSQFG